MLEGKPVSNIQIGGNGASTARLYIFVECALFLQLLFQQNKTNVSFREIACLIARNSLIEKETNTRQLLKRKWTGPISFNGKFHLA